MSQFKNLRYSITLNDAQLDYLSDEQQDILRMKCLKTFIRMAVLEETKVSGKNYSAVLRKPRSPERTIQLSYNPGNSGLPKSTLPGCGAATVRRQPASSRSSTRLASFGRNHPTGPPSTR